MFRSHLQADRPRRRGVILLSLFLGILTVVPAAMAVLLVENYIAAWQMLPSPNRKIAEDQGLFLFILALFTILVVGSFLVFVGQKIRRNWPSTSSAWIIATILFIGPSFLILTLVELLL